MRYEHIYVIEKQMQFQEKEFRTLYDQSRKDRFPITNPFYCKMLVIKQLSVCNCS
ncbi:hypothetical protein [Neobacillus notoginsengisoli]|uniref:hypothetical protein n=1 Tax=Neobacillus notoginsengisoli TaxID=1578198 RepID=UPI00131419B7|nr:hypothetical protein [Neobacillus notoginsengisoli]